MSPKKVTPSLYEVVIQPEGKRPQIVSLYLVSKQLTTVQFFYLMECWFNNAMRQGWSTGSALGALLRDQTHPTLQGVIVNACMAIIHQMARHEFTDARNHQAVMLCRELDSHITEDKLQRFI